MTSLVQGPPLARRKVALVTTAGLQVRGDLPFRAGSSDYRVIPRDTPAADIVMSHLSVNYDRTGFQEDINVVLPVDRIRELHEQGVVGALAEYDYSFMGAASITAIEPKARELAGLLKRDGVDAAVLIPV